MAPVALTVGKHLDQSRSLSIKFKTGWLYVPFFDDHTAVLLASNGLVTIEPISLIRSLEPLAKRQRM